jgi:hypothetical protein
MRHTRIDHTKLVVGTPRDPLSARLPNMHFSVGAVVFTQTGTPAGCVR